MNMTSYDPMIETTAVPETHLVSRYGTRRVLHKHLVSSVGRAPVESQPRTIEPQLPWR